MKIMVICSHYPPLPAPEGNHALLLCEHLALTGANVDLVTGTLPAGAPPPRGYRLHPEIDSWGWKGAGQLQRVARRLRPDVVILIYVAWIYLDHPMITFAPAILRRAVPGIAFVTQFENTLGGHVPKTFRERVKWRLASLAAGDGMARAPFGTLLSQSDAIVTLNDRHRDDLLAARPAVGAKVSVIPAPPLLRMRPAENGRTRAEGRARLGVTPDTFVLTYFGYIYAGKGIETLIAAVALLQKSTTSNGVRLKVVLLGRTNRELEEKLRRMATELGIADEIVWTGYQKDEDCSTFLWASDAIVLPFDEGVRLNNSSFAVSTQYALPIVTTRGKHTEPAFAQMSAEGFCTPADPAALAARIAALIASPELRQRLGQDALALAKSVFSWENTLRLTIDVLRSLPGQSSFSR